MTTKRTNPNNGFGTVPRDAAELASDPLIRRLKVAYDDVASEPFPDHLLDLLQKLEEAETRG